MILVMMTMRIASANNTEALKPDKVCKLKKLFDFQIRHQVRLDMS